MRGRSTQELSWRQIHDLYDLTAPALVLNLQPRYNGAPAQDFAACRLDETCSRAIAQFRWGLVPSSVSMAYGFYMLRSHLRPRSPQMS